MFPFIWYLWGLYFSFFGWTNTWILWLSSFFSQNSFRLSWIYFSSFWKFIFQLYRPKNIEIDTLCKRSPWPRQLWALAEQTEVSQLKWGRKYIFFLRKRFCWQWSTFSSLRRLIFSHLWLPCVRLFCSRLPLTAKVSRSSDENGT